MVIIPAHIDPQLLKNSASTEWNYDDNIETSRHMAGYQPMIGAVLLDVCRPGYTSKAWSCCRWRIDWTLVAVSARTWGQNCTNSIQAMSYQCWTSVAQHWYDIAWMSHVFWTPAELDQYMCCGPLATNKQKTAIQRWFNVDAPPKTTAQNSVNTFVEVQYRTVIWGAKPLIDLMLDQRRREWVNIKPILMKLNH